MRNICFAILLLPALAWAQPKTAEDWYKEGENQYLLGNFDKAVEAFKQGFSLETDGSKKAAYLYNVAQSYRQANDCSHALFFYKRFLALKEADTVKPLSARTRKEVGDWISELEVCVQQAASVSKKPPNTNLPPDGESSNKAAPNDSKVVPATTPTTPTTPATRSPNSVASADGPPGEDRDRGGVVVSGQAKPHVLSLRANAGGSKVSAGMFDVPVQATFAVVGGYPYAVNDKLTIEAGLAGTLTTVPYAVQAPPMMPSVTRTALLSSIVANTAATYEVIPKLGLRGDLGVGVLFFSGVSASEFTEFRATTGALSMFHLRVAAAADYAFTPNLVGTLTPIAFGYSPSKAGLERSIKQITSIDFMVGVGYRM